MKKSIIPKLRYILIRFLRQLVEERRILITDHICIIPFYICRKYSVKVGVKFFVKNHLKKYFSSYVYAMEGLKLVKIERGLFILL